MSKALASSKPISVIACACNDPILRGLDPSECVVINISGYLRILNKSILKPDRYTVFGRMFAVLSKIKKLIQKKRGLVPVESEAATIMATMMPIPLDALDSKTAPLVATTTTSATTPVAVAGSEVSVVNQAEYEDRVFRLECPELACTLIAFNRCSPVLAKYILDFYELQYEGLQTADMGPSMLARFKAECAYFQLPYHPVPRIIDQIMGNTLSEAD